MKLGFVIFNGFLKIELGSSGLFLIPTNDPMIKMPTHTIKNNVIVFKVFNVSYAFCFDSLVYKANTLYY